MQHGQTSSETPQHPGSGNRELYGGRRICDIPLSHNVIDGHDYTNAKFSEIDVGFLDRVVPNLPKIPTLALFGLTSPIGPGAQYDGYGWRNVLAEPTRWDNLKWLSMGDVKSLTTRFKANRCCEFRLWYCPPGLLHVEEVSGLRGEVASFGSWSLRDIISLPDWMFMG